MLILAMQSMMLLSLFGKQWKRLRRFSTLKYHVVPAKSLILGRRLLLLGIVLAGSWHVAVGTRLWVVGEMADGIGRWELFEWVLYSIAFIVILAAAVPISPKLESLTEKRP